MKRSDTYLPVMRKCSNITNDRVHELGAQCPLFTLNGISPGPRLVVVGDEAVMREVADIAWQFPNLVSINGSLVLRASQNDLGLDRAQETMRLTDTDPEQVFDQILCRMTLLGMFPFTSSNAA